MEIGLKPATNHALRILCYLNHHQDELPTSVTIAEKTGIAGSYFMQIINTMKQARLVKSVQGRKGGYQLARSAEEISLYDIVRVMEGDFCNSLSERENDFYLLKDNGEKLQELLTELQEQVREYLSHTYLSDV